MNIAGELAARNAARSRSVALWALTNNLPRPLVYVDIGALWGVDNDQVRQLNAMNRLTIIGFEPDEAECAKLARDNPNNRYLPVGVGDEDGLRTFYITAFGACSSFLEPDLSAYNGLPQAEMYRVARSVNLPMRRIDTLVAERAMPQPDFLKIDVQGFESAVLRGCGEAIRNIAGIRLETQFRPLYKGQDTFFRVYEDLRSHGFILRDLRLTYQVGFEAVEFEAYFSRPPQTGGMAELLRIWDMLHDIPPGRAVEVKDGKLNFSTLL